MNTVLEGNWKVVSSHVLLSSSVWVCLVCFSSLCKVTAHRFAQNNFFGPFDIFEMYSDVGERVIFMHQLLPAPTRHVLLILVLRGRHVS